MGCDNRGAIIAEINRLQGTVLGLESKLDAVELAYPGDTWRIDAVKNEINGCVIQIQIYQRELRRMR